MESKVFEMDTNKNALRIKPNGLIDKILTFLVMLAFALLIISSFNSSNFCNMPYGDDNPIETFK